MSKPYCPSNGTEGSFFESNFCDNCWHDYHYRKAIENGNHSNKACKILTKALACGDANDKDFPAEWIMEEDGSFPRCTAFLSIEIGSLDAARKKIAARRKRQKKAGQLSLFEK